jgi:hypothetical protein
MHLRGKHYLENGRILQMRRTNIRSLKDSLLLDNGCAPVVSPIGVLFSVLSALVRRGTSDMHTQLFFDAKDCSAAPQFFLFLAMIRHPNPVYTDTPSL